MMMSRRQKFRLQNQSNCGLLQAPMEAPSWMTAKQGIITMNFFLLKLCPWLRVNCS